MDAGSSYKVASERAHVIRPELETSFVQAHVEDIQDYRVLDITMNSFSQAALFKAVGADVISIEADAEHSGDNLPPLNNISERMLWLDERSFDIVICPMVLSWQTHLSKMSEQCYRVLKHSGHLLFSLGSSSISPPTKPLWHVSGSTKRNDSVIHHSCSSILNTLLATGFQLEQALPIRQPYVGAAGSSVSFSHIINAMQCKGHSSKNEDELYNAFQEYGILQPGVLGFKMLKAFTF